MFHLKNLIISPKPLLIKEEYIIYQWNEGPLSHPLPVSNLHIKGFFLETNTSPTEKLLTLSGTRTRYYVHPLTFSYLYSRFYIFVNYNALLANQGMIFVASDGRLLLVKQGMRSNWNKLNVAWLSKSFSESGQTLSLTNISDWFDLLCKNCTQLSNIQKYKVYFTDRQAYASQSQDLIKSYQTLH